MLAALSEPALAQRYHGQASPYAGQEARAIKSLSADDDRRVPARRRLGLAKAADVNGVPGPAHLPEIEGRISADDDQVAAVSAIFAAMQAEAIAGERRLIARRARARRRVLGAASPMRACAAMLAVIEASRSAPRYIHLAALRPPRALLDRGPRMARLSSRCGRYDTGAVARTCRRASRPRRCGTKRRIGSRALSSRPKRPTGTASLRPWSCGGIRHRPECPGTIDRVDSADRRPCPSCPSCSCWRTPRAGYRPGGCSVSSCWTASAAPAAAAAYRTPVRHRALPPRGLAGR